MKTWTVVAVRGDLFERVANMQTIPPESVHVLAEGLVLGVRGMLKLLHVCLSRAKSIMYALYKAH